MYSAPGATSALLPTATLGARRISASIRTHTSVRLRKRTLRWSEEPVNTISQTSSQTWQSVQTRFLIFFAVISSVNEEFKH